MKLYSTNDKANIVDLKEAVLNAFPKDRGLYMPIDIPALPASFFANIEQYSLGELGFIVAQNLIGNFIPESDLYRIVTKAIDFPAPLVKLEDNLFTQELWHGPTMAFKDFGARFMAELMSYFLRHEDRETTILVATSGDTGGAVAAGFYEVPGINVIILYPSGKVSALQEKQLNTWGKNITALEVDGVFDDCQALVKAAFIDDDLRDKYNFSSANSINIARLLPQSFYYFDGYRQLENKDKKLVYCVPSGNFGNLTAGMLAKQMGLPIHKFIAATNNNRTVPDYLKTGTYEARSSVQTISNAMDVGHPSNFPRIQALMAGSNASSTWNNMKVEIAGYSFGDSETSSAIHHIYKTNNYIADPHGAVGYLAAKEYLIKNSNQQIVFLETAHPGKFLKPMEAAIGKFEMPKKLNVFMGKDGKSHKLKKDYKSFKAYLLT